MKIGVKIKYYRERLGLTQEKIADMMNVSRQIIYKWEADLAKPEYDKLKKLVFILNITYEDLLDTMEER